MSSEIGEYTNTSTGTEDLSILAVFLSASPQQLCARGPGSTNYFPLGNHKAEYLLLFSCLGVVRMCIWIVLKYIQFEECSPGFIAKCSVYTERSHPRSGAVCLTTLSLHVHPEVPLRKLRGSSGIADTGFIGRWCKPLSGFLQVFLVFHSCDFLLPT